ncbi:GntR family transcriptional regulator [Nocardiopsis sediminis]|uniref:GntR family transcriptional regulator n=1 Tax=Nocardiopsis sediminis TaxID=1778267 RepID=A0ABV8FLB2_9ACTN
MHDRLDRGPERPLYAQIADHYRDRITRGELSPGDRLPSITAIVEKWEVSQRTAQRAIETLRAEKLVTVSRPHGTHVAPMRAAQGGRDVIAEPTGSADSDAVEVLSADIVDAPAYVADLLGIEPDESGGRKASRREAVTYRGDTPVRLSVSWAAPWAFQTTPELLEPRLVNGLRAIARSTGRVATRGTDAVEGRAADEREAGHLNLRVGAPILAGASVWSDGKGAVEYREWVCPPGHIVTHEYDVEPPLG